MPFEELLPMIGTGIIDTLYMTLLSTFFAYLLGLPIGIGLVYYAKDGLHPNAIVHRIFNIVVNVFRSIPFLILMMWVQPVTRKIVGTTLGSPAAIVPLVISAAPFVGRMVEQSLREVDRGVVEAAVSMGALHRQIIGRVFLGESLPSLINGLAISMTTILGYSAMAGIIGGGGLGALAINYGFYRYESQVMNITIVFLVLIVQIIEWIGKRSSMAMDKRRK